MAEYDVMYPAYGFAQHKGYPTAAHRAFLAHNGPCPIHRLSYAPVRLALSAHSAAHVNEHPTEHNPPTVASRERQRKKRNQDDVSSIEKSDLQHQPVEEVCEDEKKNSRRSQKKIRGKNK
jgi:hypothetical protein